MLYRSRYQLATADRRLEHVRDWKFNIVSVFIAFHRHTDIDTTALGSGDLHSETVLREIKLARVAVVDYDTGCDTGDLHGERL